MRAKHLRFACVLVCILLLLCGCKNEAENKISDTWQFNEVSHWHTCDRADCSEQHDADSHQWDAGMIKQEATCELTGQTVFTCTVCQATKTEVIACEEHIPVGEWEHDHSAHWYICNHCGRDYSQAAHKWYRATTSESGEDTEELYVCIICNLLTDEKPAVLEDPNAKPIYVGRIPSNLPTMGEGEYIFIPHMNGNNFTVESSTGANISAKRGEKTPFGKSVLIDVPVGAGTLTLKPDSIMSKEDVKKLVANGSSEIAATFSVEITGGKWWGGPVKISTTWSGLSYSTDKYSENKASLTVKFAAADLLANYDRICEDGLFVLDYANKNYDSYRFTMTPFEIVEDHEFGAQWEQDEHAHYHTCKVCGVEKDRETHKLTGKICSVCGEVKSYLFAPKADGSNFSVTNTGNADIKVYRGETELGSTAVIDVPQNANVITFTPNEILDKAKLEALQAEGITEVKAQLTARITGGQWWAGSVKITADWTGMNYTFPGTAFKNNLLGPVTVKFSVQDALDHYEQICRDGLFHFYFDNQAHDTYQISFTGFTLVTEHEWDDGWQQDESDHFHICTVCGAEKDRAKHHRTNGNTCSVCGEVKSYLFRPEADGSNFRVSNTGNANIKVSRGETELGITAVIDVPQNANVLTFTPNEILDKAKLEALQTEGITEVKARFTARITGGQWWAGSVRITADWTDMRYTFPASQFQKNLLGPVTVKFSVQDALDHYEQICQDGLFHFYFDNQAHDTYQISFTGFELVTEHEWSDIQKLDETCHARICSVCAAQTDKQEHTWETIEGIETCNICGYEDVMSYILNDFTDLTGIKVTYLNNAGVAGESTVDNNRIKLNGAQLNVWVPQWTKSGSLEFYIPLMLTKSEVKELLDSGITVFAVTIKQGLMNDHPRFGLTNHVSADWTDTTYAVIHTDDLKTLTFSLQDLYDNYEALSDGTMALLKFSIAGLAANDGGVWDGSAWVSSSYNIFIQNIEAVVNCEHSAGAEWVSDGKNHWKTCTVCGDELEVAAHTWEAVSDGQKCSVCGYEDVIVSYVLNDFTDLTGIKVTYLNNAGVAKEANAGNGGVKLTTQNNLSVWIAPWTKSKSLQFYMPLHLTKEEVKTLLDLGCTEFTVSLDQTFMNESPWWGLTNTISADWTDATYSVAHDAGWVEMSFSLQDLYDSYDAINSGEMAMFRFAMSLFSETDGGFWDGKAWVSSSHNIYLSPIVVKLSD